MARILLISGYYPPYAPAASTRAPKLAAHWRLAGHEVRVLAAYLPDLPPLLDPLLPKEALNFVPMAAASDLPGRLVPKLGGGGPSRWRRGWQRLRGLLAGVYRQITEYPDRHQGWVAPAVKAGEEILAGWRADLIYVTAPPHSGLIVGDRLARRFGIPWVAEYRDAWVTNGYYDGAWFRKPFERQLEKRVLRSAYGVVALTETTAGVLGNYFGKPAIVAMNGFDPADFDFPAPGALDPDHLTLLYAGSIYTGKRDPSALFAALTMLGEEAKRVRVHFYVDAPEFVLEMAEKHQVRDRVEIHAPVPHKQILELERAADVLLLLRWDDPREDGVIAGKLFEFIGARRPVLALGSTTGEAADIIRREHLGLVAKDPVVIAGQLRQWLAQKAAGRIADLDAEPLAAYTRERQFKRIDEFLAPLLEQAHSD